MIKLLRSKKCILAASFCFVAFALYNASPRTLRFDTSGDTIFENSALRVDQVGSMERLAVTYNLAGDVYATEDHYVLKNSAEQNFFGELGHFGKLNPNAGERVKDFIARLRATRGLRKNFGANNCVVLRSNTILVFYDKIYRSTDNGQSFRSVFDFEARGIATPFNHGVAVDHNDDVYFGEYECGRRPHEIRIVRGSADGTDWSVFHEFPSGDIFHIHSIRHDPYRDVLWVCTGDRDHESKLLYITTDRKTVEQLGAGDQGWRIVSLIPTEDFLYWCSDNDRSGSHIYRYIFETAERKQLAFVGKPSYYSTRLKDGTLVFSTTFEPASSFTKSFDPEPNTDVWISKDGEDWFKIFSVPGDVYDTPSGASRPQIILAGGDYSSDLLFLTPRYTRKSDFATKVLRITWKH